MLDHARRTVLFSLLLAVALSGQTGCDRRPNSPAGSESSPLPIVAAAPPEMRSVADYEFFTGRAEALEKVDVNSRVSGYLKKIHFHPGSEVTQGQLLVEIDPEPFKNELLRAEADLALASAKLDRSNKEFARYTALREKNAVSQDDLERVAAERLEAAAMQQAAQARIAQVQLSLEYAQIKAPIAGRIGDREVTEGNYVSGQFQNTLSALTSIVSVDPMTVAFDIDEATLQRVQRAVVEGRLKLVKEDRVPIEAGLAIDGDTYPLRGGIYFQNNQVNSKTGTIRLRAEIPNPPLNERGVRRLTPGMFVRVRVPLGEPREVALVPEAALGFDQGTRFLFVLGPGNLAEPLVASLGRQVGEQRVVESVSAAGAAPRPLQPSDQVIVSGIQRLRPGMQVDPKPVGLSAP